MYRTRKGTSGHKIHALCLKVTEEEKVKKKERPAAPDVYLGENLRGR